MRHEWTADALGSILALRFSRRYLLLLAAGSLHGLDIQTREELCEVVLGDLRRGAPPPPFMGMGNEAEAWAMFASPAEIKHYMVAAWRELPPDDRRRFLRRVV